jgi:hypothetical protein
MRDARNDRDPAAFAGAEVRAFLAMLRAQPNQLEWPAVDAMVETQNPCHVPAWERLVRAVGLEPTRRCHRGILSPLRLPVPPRPLWSQDQILSAFFEPVELGGPAAPLLPYATAHDKAKPQSGHQRLLYATSMLSVYQGRMIASLSRFELLPRTVAVLALFALGSWLGGCADMSDGMTSAFADPAKYDLYDCKQLEGERKSLANRAAELQGLMAKARTGTGGAVVAEIAYRNEYIAVRGQAKFAEDAWQSNKCHETPPPAAKPAAVPAQPTNAKPGRSPMRSGNAVY